MQCPTRNNFCYVCGLFVPRKHLKNITKTVVNSFQKIFKTAYVPYLWYTPEVVCDYCYRNLCKFTDGRSTIKYAVPTIWLPRTEHCNELCYFCVTFPETKGYQYFHRNKIRYANVESVIPAVLHSPEERTAASVEIFDDVPEISDGKSTVVPTMLSTSLAWNANCKTSEGSEYVPTSSELGTAVPHLITQADFNDLVRDGNLSKRTAELFASRFKQWNIVAADFKITAARDRGSTIPYDEFFKLHEDREKNLAYCYDIDSMFEQIGYPHVSEEWRLFIDASVNSLKVVLLHIGNKYPSIPIAYATNLKETYEGMELILQLIKYQEHNWKICCDLKVVGLLMGVKRGFPAHQCFLCTWEGRKRDQHYTEFKWKPRTCYKVGVESIENLPLVQPSQIILPPLHIKLGLVSSFVKKLNREGEAIASLRKIFPKLSDAKILAGVFNGPQIKKIIASYEFSSKLNAIEQRAWKATVAVIEQFLGKKRADNYKNIVAEMISAYGEMGILMSLKIHLLHNHLDFFPDDLGAYSDEHGERFHQDIAAIEKRFKGKDITHMLGEYCWSICRDGDTNAYKRKNKRPKFH